MPAPTRKARYAVRILRGDRFIEEFWHQSLEWATARAKYGVSDHFGRDVFDRKRMTSVVVFFPGDTESGRGGFGEATAATH